MPTVSAHAARTATAVLATMLVTGLPAAGTLDTDLVARARIFPSISVGVTAIHRDANRRYAVLTERAGIQIFDGSGTVRHVPADASPSTAIQFGVDLDLDDQGRMYVADRARNAVEIFSRDGRLERQIHVEGPTAVATLPAGEVAVASLRSAKLITVFGAEGQVVRAFGEPQEIAGRSDLNRYANIGRLCRDASGRIYYSFTYLPEPTVQRYDRFGNSDLRLVLNTEEYAPQSMSARKAIAREDSHGKQELHVVLGPVAVDPANGDIWMAIGGRLLRFFPDGTEHGSFLTFTPEEERLEASALLIEAGRILVASSNLGVFDVPKPAATSE
jgi:hypothetical protein